ncbi:MAG: hypothetical protein KA408_15175 [Flavobacteriales bacterium]|nr:hypothetical protein [Flavobacteriales bacterium]
MRLTLRPLLAVILLMFFTGCLTIEENYVFKKDGSGTMEYVVDLSEMGELMKSFEDASKDGGEGGASDLSTMDMEEEVAALQKIPGIQKVKVNKKVEWVQRVSFKFKDLVALNAALNVLMPDSSGTTTEFFKWEGNDLVRINNDHAYELGAGMAESANEGEEQAEEGSDMDMSAMLETMKYKFSFKFAQPLGTVVSAPEVTAERPGTKEFRMETDFGIIGKDRKALDLRFPLNK